jgi:KaiC/GvpD/RAD55 family RecA-like ATPase
MTIEEMLRMQYKLLGHEGLGWTEFRVLNPLYAHVYLENTEEGFIRTGLALIAKKDSNLYVGLNPRREKRRGDLTNVAYCNLLLIDIDPERPTGEPSTDEQHKRALELGSRITTDICDAVCVDSGSGCHVYLPIIPRSTSEDALLAEKIKAYHASLRYSYEQMGLKIDHTHDLPRVTRLWGSWNLKSNRLCYPLTEFKGNRINIELPNITYKGESSLVITNYSTECPRFNTLVENNPVLKSILKGEGDYVSPSEANYAFVSILTKAQFDTASIKRLIKLSPFSKKSIKTDDQFEMDIERIIEKISNDGIGSISMLHGSARYLRALNTRKSGYSTGLKQLDDKLSGLQNGKLYVIAARTNEGKTSFACNLAYNLIKQGTSVLYFPTELGYEPLFDKIISTKTEIPLSLFQKGTFTDAQKNTIKACTQELSSYSFIVYEDFSLTAKRLKEKAKEICPEVIILDYIQAMSYTEGGSPNEIASVVRELKELNEQLSCPVIMCSQLNRGAIGNELSLSQLKGSGAIEEFADVVMALSTLSRFDYPRPVDLYILKSRYSETGRIKMNFFSHIGKFEEKINE